MMGRLFLVLCVAAVATAAPTDPKQTELKDFTFDEIIPNQFGLRSFNGTWLTGNELLYRDRDTGTYIKHNLDTEERIELLTSNVLSKWRGASIQMIGPQFTKILVRYEVRTVFRHSSLSKYAIYDTETTLDYDVAGGNEVSICTVAPNGQSLVYVQDNNVFYRASLVDPTEVPLSSDGVPGIIYNGVPDWVYEEEVFGTDATLWISPDGQWIAMASFDDREVKEFSYQMYGNPDDPEHQYPEEYKIRYPKVNTTNPIVHLRVKDLTDPNSLWINIPAPVADVGEDHVLGTVNWAGPSLGVIWTNRRQNFATYQKCNPATGSCVEAVRFDVPSGWYDLYTPRCYSNGDRCFLLGNSDGWRRIWEVTGSDSPIFRSPVRYTVSSINGYDEASGNIFYTAVPADNPHHRHVFRNDECISCTLLKDALSNDTPCNYASISFSTDQSYMAATCSGPTPSYTILYRTADLSVIENWEDNLDRRTQLEQYKKQQIRYLRVPVPGGFQAAVRLYLPPEIDFENPDNNNGMKYPMIVNVYAGPNSVRVTDSFGIGFSNYMTTTKKTIYCQIDGRGTGNQGDDFLFSINNRLGTYEMEDQIGVARYLHQTYAFIDSERTGIWGSSYGGYATAATLEKDTQSVFRCGISVAPVTSWMFYDSIYTERYMGLPRPDDNEEGYDRGDISMFTDELKNHLFMLIHGTADDNVHYQQSMVFLRAMLDNDIDFDQMTYPDEAHSLSGVQRHLYHTMDLFWDKCFA